MFPVRSIPRTWQNPLRSHDTSTPCKKTVCKELAIDFGARTVIPVSPPHHSNWAI